MTAPSGVRVFDSGGSLKPDVRLSDIEASAFDGGPFDRRDTELSEPASDHRPPTGSHAEAGVEASRAELEASLFIELAETVGGSSPTHTVDALCRLLAPSYGLERALIFLPLGDKLVPRLSSDPAGPELEIEVPLPLVDAVAGSGHPAVAGRSSPLVPAAWAELLQCASAVAVPLGRGVCLFSTGEERRFTARDIRVVWAAARLVAGELEQRPAPGSDAFRSRAESEIHRLVEYGTKAVSVEETAEVLARAARDAASCDAGIVLLSDSNNRITHVVGVGIPPRAHQRLRNDLIGLPVAKVPGWNGAAHSGPSFSTEAGVDLAGLDLMRGIDLGSFALLPLMTGENLIGLVLVTSALPGRKFLPEQRQLLTQITREGAMIVENAFLRTTDQERRHELAYGAFHDPLTRLPNRALFDDRVEHALARADRRHEGIAVLFVDLDDFRVVNDRFGYEIGNQLLVAVSKRLKDCLRPGDTIARHGGDEFTVLVEEVNHDDVVRTISERVTRKLQEPFLIDGRQITVTVSVGIAMSWPGCMEAGELVRNADLALYRAKHNGKARAEVFSFARDALGQVDIQGESALRRAIEGNEFVIHYQPKVDLYSGKIVGMEALVRWEDPERGLVPPLDFIPLAESTGLIVPIGRWVLETVCFQLRRWREWYSTESLPTVYVNLSAGEFKRPTLVEEINELLRRSEILPRHLGLEITETTMMDEADDTVETLRALRSLGVKLAIDDFGAGYSSLSYLKRFPVDTLKIDRQFVQNLPNSEDEAIVRAVVSMAQTMKQGVVAEGVETLEQIKLLRDWGADVGQGYYFSKPVPVGGAEQLVAKTPLWIPQANLSIPPAP